MGAIGTVTALAGAAATLRVPAHVIRRCNGAFLITVALFMQWRQRQVSKPEEEEDYAEVSPAGESAQPQALAAALPQPQLAAEHFRQGYTRPGSASEDLPRLILLGAAGGACLGFFGVGVGWMLAPALTYMDPRRRAAEAAGTDAASPSVGEAGFGAPLARIGTSGAEDRDRRTATLAMVPPSIAAAFRHFMIGHCPTPFYIAFPLALGAIAGSAVGGPAIQQMEPIMEFDEKEQMLSVFTALLFAQGAWLVFRPKG
eukprot:gnl/TRDRNA2_/TRDRNA2_89900_c1_seq1.p1 gnl/TRDRNA2_/TRDRNA2_89900_c1~~gnl/TRDRNA2_/TRDRNA2_89900_c1_seq1.p1  ORF type:complete len:271 (-),score=39.02 gnl/TRDRNA2_/TRDRNA2_89900_c1_seq1:145-915(-)